MSDSAFTRPWRHYNDYWENRDELYTLKRLTPFDADPTNTAGGFSIADAFAFQDWRFFQPEMVAQMTGIPVADLTLADRFPTGLPPWKATLYARLYEMACDGKAPQWAYQMMLAIGDSADGGTTPFAGFG